MSAADRVVALVLTLAAFVLLVLHLTGL